MCEIIGPMCRSLASEGAFEVDNKIPSGYMCMHVQRASKHALPGFMQAQKLCNA